MYMDNEMLDSYRAYVQSQCSFYSPGNDDYLAGEIIFQWFNRKSLQREMSGQQAELSRMDGVLSGLLYEQKKRLSRLGRNGGWSKWLSQHKIPRATADRLVLEHVEFFGLQHELPHRERVEPLQANVCLAACRTSEKFEQMLKSPKSRMVFLRCLADRFGLGVDLELDGSVRLSLSPPISEENIDYRVPNIIEVQQDGTVKPVNYELRDEADDSVFYPDVRRTARPNALREQSKEFIQ
jgi:hypothetical protein